MKPSGEWHNFHAHDCKDRPKSGREQVDSADRAGKEPKHFGQKLAVLAEKFRRCKPIGDHLVYGFYDVPLPEFQHDNSVCRHISLLLYALADFNPIRRPTQTQSKLIYYYSVAPARPR